MARKFDGIMKQIWDGYFHCLWKLFFSKVIMIIRIFSSLICVFMY